MKKDFKKYHSDILSKDFSIAFFAGIGGGMTVLFFSFVLKFLLEGDYVMAGRGLIAYVLVAMTLYYFLDWLLRKTYGKKE